MISIKDRGTGIDTDTNDKIFSKFATKSDIRSGLGLIIPTVLLKPMVANVC